jgi:hypothetical protein
MPHIPSQAERKGKDNPRCVKSDSAFGEDPIFGLEPSAPGRGDGGMIRPLVEALTGGMSATDRGGDGRHPVSDASTHEFTPCRTASLPGAHTSPTPETGRKDRSRWLSCDSTRRATKRVEASMYTSRGRLAAPMGANLNMSH